MNTTTNNENGIYRDIQPHEEILSCILYDPSVYQEIKHRLTAEMFYEYSWLYNIIRKADEENSLNFKGIAVHCSATQLPTIHDFRKAFISHNRLPDLIKRAKGRLLSDRLSWLARQIIAEATPDNADDSLRELQRQAYELFTTDTENLVDPERDVDRFVEWVEEIMKDPSKAFGLLTGYEDIDQITTGWHRGDLIVLGGWTSMGKSAFMIENVMRLHQAGYKCAIFSLEMSKNQILSRMMTNLMGISLKVLRTGQMAKELLPKFKNMSQDLKGIYIDDTRGVDSEYISDVSRRLKRTQGLDFVVVDYLQEVKEQGETNDNSGSSIGRVCRKLRVIAKECDVPIMALSQVTRESQKRQDKRPVSADLSGSTGIETSADVIALLYRDEYYDQNSENRGIMEVNFTKQRNGELGMVEMYYDKQSQRIRPLSKH